jgi:hypothetical protein
MPGSHLKGRTLRVILVILFSGSSSLPSFGFPLQVKDHQHAQGRDGKVKVGQSGRFFLNNILLFVACFFEASLTVRYTKQLILNVCQCTQGCPNWPSLLKVYVSLMEAMDFWDTLYKCFLDFNLLPYSTCHILFSAPVSFLTALLGVRPPSPRAPPSSNTLSWNTIRKWRRKIKTGQRRIVDSTDSREELI